MALAVGLMTSAMATSARAATYTVTNLGDSGAGSLRQAIIQANANPGADTIVFSLASPPNPAFVYLQTTLTITDDVTITGPVSTQVVLQPDPFSGPPQITLMTITSTPTVHISGLSFTGGHGVNGGAISAVGGSLTIDSCSIYLNNADNAGGGVSMMGAGNASLTITNSSIFANNAMNIGGGVSVTRFTGSATVNVSGSTFSRNTTTGTGVGHFGGGLYVAGGSGPHTVTINTSTINDNSLAFDGKGGGVYVDAVGGSLSMTNSTLSGNIAEMGGGLGYQNATLTILACTITSNNSTTAGDGVIHDASMMGMSVKNTILSGNISGGTFRDLADTQTATGNNNLVGVGGPFTNGVAGNIVGVTDPRLTPINTNGGLTMTFSLKPDSPALDTGSNADSPATDQRGQPRPADGNNDGVATVDIGAFETQRYLVTNTLNAGAGSLRQAISDNNMAGGGFIKFAIPTIGQQKTIVPKSPLPTITRICFIDGWSQGGNSYHGPPLVEIDGGNIQNAIGLDIQWSDCILRGLAVNNFLGTSNAVGFKISSRSGLRNWIYGCYAGIGLDGVTNRGNAQIGIWIAPTANSNLIGSNADGFMDDAERNVIGGSNRTGLQTGIYIESNSNIISGNYVGTDVSGTVAIPNFNGIWVVSGTSNQIGSNPTTTSPDAARNVVSGNTNVGIDFSSQGSNNFVSGNYVGIRANGMGQLPNMVGVMLDDSNRTLIGGTSVGERNVISGNAAQGIIINGTGAYSNLVQGNYIGLDAMGATAIPNQMGGVLVRQGATFTRIGAFGDNSGLETARRNVISGNGAAGVTLQDPASNDNRVMGCYIGLDATGANPIGNAGAGVVIMNSPTNQVGAPGTGRNYICAQSGPGGDGVDISGLSSIGNKVRNNMIGATPGGAAAGNAQAGVRIFGSAQANSVGGVNAGEGNTIINNGHGGVLVLDDDSIANSILGNSIFANTGLGIDLRDDGVTPNGLANQVRIGPNSLQNYPVIDAVSSGGAITGTLTAIGLTKYRVEFFSNPVADPSNYGEGRTYLGFAEVTTNAAGVVPVGVSVTLPPGEGIVTATATELAPDGAVRGFPTDPGMPLGTSEFAMVRAANTAPTTSNQVANTLEDTDVTITLLANDPDPGNTITFRISGLPAVGQLLQFGTFAPITAAGTSVSDAGGRVVFRPAPNAFGSPYTTFNFIANDGFADSNESTVTVNVTPVNDPPAGADKTVTISEDGSYTFAAGDFGFTDPIDLPANAFLAVKITTLPAAGSLKLGAAPVTLGQFIPVASIPNLNFTPAANATGSPYTSFTFQVQDDGGTANGGLDLDQSPNTFTFNVTGINDPPSGADKTVTINEDATYTFAASDFGFSDPNDTPPNNFLAVKITTLPGAGSLKLGAVPVTLGQFIPVASIPTL
ncbi:MAG TPA: choice-of-anchor Q domain-containing protein, partial [Phycisphaerales bacterium]|nr:choice-of-anchor Q domain-containing protein [Phycisphaerales bacterium]